MVVTMTQRIKTTVGETFFITAPREKFNIESTTMLSCERMGNITEDQIGSII